MPRVPQGATVTNTNYGREPEEIGSTAYTGQKTPPSSNNVSQRASVETLPKNSNNGSQRASVESLQNNSINASHRGSVGDQKHDVHFVTKGSMDSSILKETGSRSTGRSGGNRRSTGRQSLLPVPLPMNAEAGGATGVAIPTVNMFADADAMREKIHENIAEKDYDVADFYWDSGFCQAIARNAKFDSLTLIVILLNAVWLGIDAECNDPNATEDIPNCPAQQGDDTFWQIGEQLFCVFFTFELTVRFGAFKLKRSALQDMWFCFDSVLVFFMVVETWILPIVTGGSADVLSDFVLIRMLRLMRLTRMVRLMRSVPELVTLLKGMVIAFRSVSYTLLLLLIFMYIFSIIFKSQLVDTEVKLLQDHFSGIPMSMWTLLLNGCLLDGVGKIANGMMKESLFLAATFVFFVLLSSLMVLNMLIGVLCAVVTAVAAVEKEKALVNYVKSKLMSVLEQLDEDGSGEISKEEFDNLVKVEEAVKALEELGVDVPNLVSLSDHLFDASEDFDDDHPRHSKHSRHASEATTNRDSASNEILSKEMSFADFLEMVIRLRSDCQPSVADIVDLRKLIFKGQKQFGRRVSHIEKGQQDLQRTLRMICEHLDAAMTLSLQLSDGSDGNNLVNGDASRRDATTTSMHNLGPTEFLERESEFDEGAIVLRAYQESGEDSQRIGMI